LIQQRSEMTAGGKSRVEPAAQERLAEVA